MRKVRDQAPRRRTNVQPDDQTVRERERERGGDREREREREKRTESLMRATIQCVEHRPRGMQPAPSSSIHKFIPAAFLLPASFYRLTICRRDQFKRCHEL